MKKLFTFVTVLFVFTNFFSQNEHLSGFVATSLLYKFDKKWFAYGELQTRSKSEFSTPDYYEIKGGLGYNINPNNQAFVGLGRYADYTKNSISKEEFRVWLQYTYNYYLGKLKLENRARIEQRFFHNPVSDINTKGNRFRYRLNAILPINSQKLQPKTFFVNAYDEMFLGTDTPAIMRNRIFAGGGYQFNENFGIASGYLFQRDFSTISNSNLHFLYLAFNFTIDHLQDKKEIHVPAAD